MDSVLDKAIVLSLNRNWQRLGYKTVRQAITDLCGGSYGKTAPALAVAITIDENGELVESTPMAWDEWCELPVRPCDLSISTGKKIIRCPVVIVSMNFAKMPMKKAKLTNHAIHERDGGICGYTGVKLPRHRLSVDHVIPKKLGGRDTWDNMVTCDKEINSKKGHKTNEEAGLRLTRTLKEPLPVPVSATVREARRPEHEPFIDR